MTRVTRRNVLIPVTEVLHQVMEDLRVHVLTELHQNEPVPEVKLLHDESDVLPPAGLGTAAEHEHTGEQIFRVMIYINLKIVFKISVKNFVVIDHYNYEVKKLKILSI